MELLIAYGGGGVYHQIDGFGGFGEGYDFAEAACAGEDHDDAVEAEGDAAVRGRAVLESVEEEAEALALASSSDMPRERKISAWTSLRWIRMEPEPSSVPLRTMS